MEMHHVRLGAGRPLVLIHGLGGTWRSWKPVLDLLATEREVIAVDLPGHGDTPPLPGKATIGGLTDAVASFLAAQHLLGSDIVGSSMGARLVLEMARRGGVGAVVSLDPGGFWNDRERTFFRVTIGLSIRLVRLLNPVLPLLTGNPIGRTLLFAQFSARPWSLPPEVALEELRGYVSSPSFDELLHDLGHGPGQEGMPRGRARKPITIGWGRRDRVCFPRQAERAAARFPDAKVHWFEGCGHFPQWDSPGDTVRMILASTADLVDISA